MAMKNEFALEMNGTKLRSIQELQENFDLDTAVQYLQDGKLLTWLEDLFYEDEAEKIAELDKNAPHMKQQLCKILGVESEDDSWMDAYELERLNEKKRLLKTMTDDEDIIANADKTALDQTDLANLLRAGANTIYLCGDNFTVPIRFGNKKYIGILKKPNVKIKAATDSELEEKGIVFENVSLPWRQGNDSLPSQSLNTSNTEETKYPHLELPMWMRKAGDKTNGVTSSANLNTSNTEENEEQFTDIPKWMQRKTGAKTNGVTLSASIFTSSTEENESQSTDIPKWMQKK